MAVGDAAGDAAALPDAALAGVYHGHRFDVEGAIATPTNGTIYVVLANNRVLCGLSGPSNPDALLIIRFSVPPGAQKPGAYSIGAAPGQPQLAVVCYSFDGGVPYQDSTQVSSGTLYVSSATTTLISGALDVSDPVASVSFEGRFDAAICTSDGG